MHLSAFSSGRSFSVSFEELSLALSLALAWVGIAIGVLASPCTRLSDARTVSAHLNIEMSLVWFKSHWKTTKRSYVSCLKYSKPWIPLSGAPVRETKAASEHAAMHIEIIAEIPHICEQTRRG